MSKFSEYNAYKGCDYNGPVILNSVIINDHKNLKNYNRYSGYYTFIFRPFVSYHSLEHLTFGYHKQALIQVHLRSKAILSTLAFAAEHE